MRVFRQTRWHAEMRRPVPPRNAGSSIRLWSALCLSSLVLLGPAALNPARAQAAPLVFLTEGAKPPWNFYGGNGKLAGFEIDLIDELCTRLRRSCAFQVEEWEALVPLLNAGKADAAVSGINITRNRQAMTLLTEPYAVEAYGFAVFRGSPAFQMPDKDLRIDPDSDAGKASLARIREFLGKRRIGVVMNTRSQRFLTAYFPGAGVLRKYAAIDEHNLDLPAGRVDLTFAPTASYLIERKFADFKDVVGAGPVFVSPAIGPSYAIALPRGRSALKQEIDAALASAKSDGVIRRLSLKWFKVDLTPP